jgi:DNA-binding response OmpR family regulator
MGRDKRYGGQMKKVLVIDDEVLMVTSLCIFLHKKGYSTCAAPDCATGLKLFETISPDIILLDLILPDGHGLDLLRKIKDISPSCVVIIMSGTLTPGITKEAISLGAKKCLWKPFSYLELEDALKDCLPPPQHHL